MSVVSNVKITIEVGESDAVEIEATKEPSSEQLREAVGGLVAESASQADVVELKAQLRMSRDHCEILRGQSERLVDYLARQDGVIARLIEFDRGDEPVEVVGESLMGELYESRELPPDIRSAIDRRVEEMQGGAIEIPKAPTESTEEPSGQEKEG